LRVRSRSRHAQSRSQIFPNCLSGISSGLRSPIGHTAGLRAVPLRPRVPSPSTLASSAMQHHTTSFVRALGNPPRRSAHCAIACADAAQVELDPTLQKSDRRRWALSWNVGFPPVPSSSRRGPTPLVVGESLPRAREIPTHPPPQPPRTPPPPPPPRDRAGRDVERAPFVDAECDGLLPSSKANIAVRPSTSFRRPAIEPRFRCGPRKTVLCLPIVRSSPSGPATRCLRHTAGVEENPRTRRPSPLRPEPLRADPSAAADRAATSVRLARGTGSRNRHAACAMCPQNHSLIGPCASRHIASIYSCIKNQRDGNTRSAARENERLACARSVVCRTLRRILMPRSPLAIALGCAIIAMRRIVWRHIRSDVLILELSPAA